MVDIDLSAMVPRISITLTVEQHAPVLNCNLNLIPGKSERRLTSPTPSSKTRIMAIFPNPSGQLSTPCQLSMSRNRSASVDRHPPGFPKADSNLTSLPNSKTKIISMASRKIAIIPSADPCSKKQLSHSVQIPNRKLRSSATRAGSPQNNGLTIPSSGLKSESVKYERNLKKFHQWCKHCNRLKAAAENKLNHNQEGLLLTATTASNGKPNKMPSLSSNSNANSSQRSKLLGFSSSDLPLKRPSFHLDPNAFARNMPEKRERPKSAKLPEKTSEPISIDKPKFSSLFNFDDALSLSPGSVDLNWMSDPWDSDDDDYRYDIDIDTMSICSDNSIIPLPITCDTKLKEDDLLFCAAKSPLRKTASSR